MKIKEFTICGRMLNWGLSMSQVMLYALIYTETKKYGDFRAHLNEIAEGLNMSVSTVKRDLNKLVKSGLLVKEDINVSGAVKTCIYRTIKK